MPSVRMFFFVVLVFVLSPSLAFALDANREQRISNELDCVQQHLKTNASMDWSDVCYFPPQEKDTKNEIVNKALDAIDPSSTKMDDSVVVPEYKSPEVELKSQPRVKLLDVQVGAAVGFRQDKLVWNIADSDGNPDILSELTWKDLMIFEHSYTARATASEHFVVEGMLALGSIYDGENQDSDYLGSGRKFEFSRSNNASGDGSTLDWSLGGGYKVNLFDGEEDSWLNATHISATALGGYSYHEQNLRMYDGHQTIPATGAFDNLHSSYDAQWQGPWGGVEFKGSKGKGEGFLRLEYHMADYEAEANWNLRSDFQHPKSFEHEAEGYGIVFVAGGSYDFTPRWSVEAKVRLQHWETGHGTDRTFMSDGSVGETQLNEVKWDSMGANVGAKYRF